MILAKPILCRFFVPLSFIAIKVFSNYSIPWFPPKNFVINIDLSHESFLEIQWLRFLQCERAAIKNNNYAINMTPTIWWFWHQFGINISIVISANAQIDFPRIFDWDIINYSTWTKGNVQKPQSRLCAVMGVPPPAPSPHHGKRPAKKLTEKKSRQRGVPPPPSRHATGQKVNGKKITARGGTPPPSRHKAVIGVFERFPYLQVACSLAPVKTSSS